MTSKLVLNHCIKKSDKGKLREEKIWMILFVIYQESWFRWIISDTLTRHPSAWTAQETGYMRLALSTSVQLSSVQSLIRVRLFATPWTAARQASLSITNSQSPPKPCPFSRWCHPTISSSVVPFSSCPQSFPASRSFQMSQLFASGAKVLEFQLQNQSFQWTPRTDLP